MQFKGNSGSLRKQPTSSHRDDTTVFFFSWNEVWGASAEILLMTRHCPDLGSTSVRLKIFFIQSEVQHRSDQWHVTRYGISALVSQTSFRVEAIGGVAKCRLFLKKWGALASTTATAAKTSLLQCIRVFSNFSRLFQIAENVKCRRISFELISWGPLLKFRKTKRNSPYPVYVLEKTWN